MKANFMRKGVVAISFEKPEIAVLERYIKVLRNSEVECLPDLVEKLFEQQFNFIMDCMVEEASIKVDDLVPKFTRWQKVCRWLGNL